MTIPLSIILTDRGASGVPTTTNPQNLGGIAESYEDTIDDRYGFSTARTEWTPSRNDVLEWARADHLLRPMVAYSPDARIAWEGFLAEIEIDLGTKKIAFSLKDMANRLTVRYSTDSGGQGDSTTYSSTASQALYGIKDRVINASIASSAAAGNQAQTVLNTLAFPRSKQPSSAGTPRGGLKITLTFWGKYALLDWLLTANTSTTTTTTSTQIGSLLSAYAGVNNFFSTSSANIAATGVSDTEYIEPDTTYREKIERLLARGNSSQQPLAWGFYEGSIFKVETRASATPTTITYFESEASGQIRDAYGNVVDPWDIRPNAMAQVIDLIDVPLVGAAETPLRKYVSRVSRRISGNEVSVSLEPEDTESLEAILTAPTGGGPAGTSDRQAQIERKIIAPIRSTHSALDNPTRYDGAAGVWKPAAGGTGVANTGTIDLGGGSITPGGGIDLGTGGSVTPGGGVISNTGGGNIDLGTGTGIGGGGSSGVTVSGTGTSGRVTQWGASNTLADSTLIKSGAGVLTLSSSGAFTLTVPATGTAALGTGSASALAKWSGTNTLTTATAGTDFLAGSGTSGRLAQWGASNALADSTLIKSGGGVLTLSAGSTATLTIDSTTRIDGSGASSNDVLTWNGTAYAPAAVSAAPIGAKYIVQTADATLTNEQALSSLSTGVMKSTTTTGVVSTMTGTSGRITEWSDGTTIGASTLIKSGAGVLTLSAGSTATLTIDSTTRINGTGASSGDVLTWNGTAYAPATPSTGVTGGGTTNRMAYWSGTSALTSDSGFTYDATNNRLDVGSIEVGVPSGSAAPGQIIAKDDLISETGVRTPFGNLWDFGGGTVAVLSAIQYLTVKVDGTTFRILCG